MSIARSVSPEIYIIADDLSGAADAGVSFLGGTSRVRICLDTEHPWDFALGTDTVQVLLTDTRKLSAAASSALVEQVLRPLRSREGAMIYQKIDSTMRGTVGAEIEATLKTLGRRIAVLTPTFPQTNRIVFEGRLVVEGRPVTLTQYANDPRDPIRHDAVKDIVAETSSGLKIVSCGPRDLLQTINEVDRGQDLICVVVDSETDNDLEIIATVLSQRSEVLPVGSAGLAKHLASRWIPGGELVSLKLSSENRPQKVLVASGSANPRSHAQIRELVRSMRVPFIYLDAPSLLNPIEGEAIMRQTTEHLLESEDRIIGVALTGHRVGAEFTSGLEEYIGRLGAAWLDRFETEPVAVVAFGADTCVSVCRESRISVLWPQGEILPGIPLNRVRENVGIVTKAGGFGSDDALVTIARFLTGIDLDSWNEPRKKAQEHRVAPMGGFVKSVNGCARRPA